MKRISGFFLAANNTRSSSKSVVFSQAKLHLWTWTGFRHLVTRNQSETEGPTLIEVVPTELRTALLAIQTKKRETRDESPVSLYQIQLEICSFL